MKKVLKLFVFVSLIFMTIISGALLGCGAESEPQDGEYSSTLSISCLNLTIEKGKSDKIFAGYNDKSEIYFISSDDKIVTVTSNEGVATVTAVSVGKAYITISAGNQTKICEVTVFESNYNIVFDRIEGEGQICINTKFQVNAVVERDGVIDSNLTVTWSVKGGDCELNCDGNCAIITPKTAGEIIIIATYGNTSSTLNYVVPNIG